VLLEFLRIVGSPKAVPGPCLNSSPTDQELVSRAKAGDRKAFDLLFARYNKFVVRLVVSIVKDDSTAEDLAQDTWLKIWEKIGTLNGPSFGAWLRPIAKRTALDFLRTSRASEELTPDVQDPTTDLEGEVLAKESRRVVSDLPARKRQILELNEKGLTYRELSKRLDIPIGTVKSRLHGARQAFREQLEEKETV